MPTSPRELINGHSSRGWCETSRPNHPDDPSPVGLADEIPIRSGLANGQSCQAAQHSDTPAPSRQTKLVYLNARHPSRDIGRFQSVDPVRPPVHQESPAIAIAPDCCRAATAAACRMGVWTVYAGSVEFEWDLEKAESNLQKHGVGFDEAATAFADPLSLTIPDPDHSTEEDRFVLIGETYGRRLIVVVFTERGDRFRIISARLATRRERRPYEG